jgi:hypothetical protein
MIPGGGPERTLVPARHGPLLQVGAVLGPAARLLPDLSSARIGRWRMMPLGPVAALCVIRVIRVIRAIRAAPKLTHAHQYHRFVT